MPRIRLHIKGRVQGVGFRPFVYRCAKAHRLGGHVRNDPAGVLIEAHGTQAALRAFIKDIRHKAPPASHIEHIVKANATSQDEGAFEIKKSVYGKEKFVFISPDLSICAPCRKELFDTGDRRYHHPFINCTNCGPRYSIIKNIPYDRPKTTMKPFRMCNACKREYDDPLNRRFHAQPNSCFACGPAISFVRAGEKPVYLRAPKATRERITKAASHIRDGHIIAVKGIGGYHLCCDAKNIKSVALLRQRKRRPTKPFALMAESIASIKQICHLSSREEQLLTGCKRPIVLLRIKNRTKWMHLVAPEQHFLGIMLAYAPLHYLLFDRLRTRRDRPLLVMTSANRSSEPLIKDEKKIFTLSDIADSFLTHNRAIYMRCDDSIARLYNNKEYIIRKARGYVPDFFDFETPYAMLGCGAELKSTFSITKNNYLITSPYLGDLKSYGALTYFKETLAHFQSMFSFTPQYVAYDRHPAYLSTQYAHSLEGVTPIATQHHHAHAAACMLEHGLTEELIAVVFDGIGFGPDEAVWGGEFFICDRTSFARAAFFDYFGLVGKDKAIEEPWRVAAYIMYELFGERLFDVDIPFTRTYTETKLASFLQLIRQKNFVATSSVGRMFDAAASLLGIRDVISYEAEAAITLEMYALGARKKRRPDIYPFDIIKRKKHYTIRWQPLYERLIRAVQRGEAKETIACSFHHTLASIVEEVCCKIRTDTGHTKIVLSGGVFQNWLLLNSCTQRLKKRGFTVFTHSRFPPNDACVSVGQIAIAQAQLFQGKGSQT